jgi:hypothetical protein
MTTTATTAGTWRDRIERVLDGSDDAVLTTLSDLFDVCYLAGDVAATAFQWRACGIKMGLGIAEAHETGVEIPAATRELLRWLAMNADFAERMDRIGRTESTETSAGVLA